MELVLASSSPNRKNLLSKLKLPFTSKNPDIDETPLPGEAPQAMVTRLAEAKAQAVAHLYPNSLIIGSDQTIELDGISYGKPLTHENAVKQLQTFSGKRINSYTGICLLNTYTQQKQTAVVNYNVEFRTLTQDKIECYLQKENVLQCAGSLKAEGAGIMLIERFIGDDPTALIGLPLIHLVRMLENEGVDFNLSSFIPSPVVEEG